MATYSKEQMSKMRGSTPEIIKSNYQKIKGNGLIIKGNYNEIIGDNNHITGNYNELFGHNNNINGNYNESFGTGITMIGNYNENKRLKGKKLVKYNKQQLDTVEDIKVHEFYDKSLNNEENEELNDFMKEFK